jgi:hypothetical protein
MTTTTTVYCARWTDYGGGWEHSSISWKELEMKVFGQAYSPNRDNVRFTSYQRVQGDS